MGYASHYVNDLFIDAAILRKIVTMRIISTIAMLIVATKIMQIILVLMIKLPFLKKKIVSVISMATFIDDAYL